MPEFRRCERYDRPPHRSKAFNNFGNESGFGTDMAVIVLTCDGNAVIEPARGRRSVDAIVPSYGVTLCVCCSHPCFWTIRRARAGSARSSGSDESIRIGVSAVDHVRVKTWRTQ